MNKANLLITTIGEIDCIESWITNERNYDIAFIFYPEEIDEETKKYLTKNSDYLFYEQGFKYEIIQRVLYNNQHLLEYDFFWMPDHDVLFRKGNVNLLFEFMKKYNLKLGQPSLVNKNRSWKILVNKKFLELRYINLVEVMCPAFSKDALDICLKTFSWSKSGWGLGLLWGKLINNNKAVIDSLIVEHTNKMDTQRGALYKKLLATTGKTPEQERDYLVSKHDLDTSIKHIKKVPQKGFIGNILNWFY